MPHLWKKLAFLFKGVSKNVRCSYLRILKTVCYWDILYNIKCFTNLQNLEDPAWQFACTEVFLTYCYFSPWELLEYQSIQSYWLEWFRLLRFQERDTKLDRFLPKNQYTRRKISYFVNWCSRELSKIGIILENKVF